MSSVKKVLRRIFKLIRARPLVWVSCLLAATLPFFVPHRDSGVEPAINVAITETALQEIKAPARLGLVGRIEPAIEMLVTAPFAGRVLSIDVTEGQRVERGQRLLTLDTVDVDAQLRTSLSDVLTSRRAVQDLEKWETGPEMSRARRVVVSAEQGLADTQRKLRAVQALFDIGIVPRMELDALILQRRSQHRDVTMGKEELEHVRLRANSDSLQIAKMALTNAEAKHEAILATQRQREVVAHFAGVVVRARPATPADIERPIIEGVEVERGQPLLGLASMDRLQVSSLVDEMDVALLDVGAHVEITGDAFDGVTLTGRVSTIGIRGREATTPGARAKYQLVADILPPPEAERSRIRLNMSARLSISTSRVNKF